LPYAAFFIVISWPAKAFHYFSNTNPQKYLINPAS